MHKLQLVQNKAARVDLNCPQLSMDNELILLTSKSKLHYSLVTV